jgi:hypothetical protein
MAVICGFRKWQNSAKRKMLTYISKYSKIKSKSAGGTNVATNVVTGWPSQVSTNALRCTWGCF